eukprot:TRINITY_DN4974_c0_g1_i1.p1 TRINITY_DN4974_c0_g1~~TRINITY_DN4974_c0_g1_i1.p1  ORF type:complete len:288 (-),score=118.00 TRINITY_DN4974_c0_g1_i1:94-873(-)
MSSKVEEKTEEIIDKTKMMKGGLKDRSLYSWVRILLVTTIWWTFVGGFFCLCFFLMNHILYGSDDTQPHFVRNFLKYPGILQQPGLNIKCKDLNCDTTMLTIGINKIFNFVPEAFAEDEYPDDMKDELKKLGVTNLPKDHVFVTCGGRKQDDKDNLEGMKINGTAGFPVAKFPWRGQESWITGVSVDLSNTTVVRNNGKQQVEMVCMAWAKNIKTEKRFVEKKTQRGGALSSLCFEAGRIFSLRTVIEYLSIYSSSYIS